MSRDPLRETLRRYERRLELLVDEEGHLEARLAEVKQGIGVLGRAVEAQREALNAYPDLSDGDSHPDEEPPSALATSTPSVPPQSDSGSFRKSQTSVPRREKIYNLLSQDSTRWWKVRDIAAAIDESNLKSLRVTIGLMVEKGELIKLRTSSRSAWFRSNDNVDRPGPSAEEQEEAERGGGVMLKTFSEDRA